MIKKTFKVIIFLALLAVLTGPAEGQISLSDEEAGRIGDKIFNNECASKVENLVAWNEGEDFMSLGIGHFIWYPKGKLGPFGESFPDLLKFIGRNGGVLPDWLKESEDPDCPWRNRGEFLRNPQDSKVGDLREFMIRTMPLQLRFIIGRLDGALPKMLKAAPEELRPGVEKQYYRMASTPAGIYALVDYVNFKGEGTLITENHKGHGWGLLQVLEGMSGDSPGAPAVREFVRVAGDLLTERVNNSSNRRVEEKWLPGWKNRLSTYIDSMQDLQVKG